MMKPFRAIVALTFRNALRSHIFQLLLILLLLCITVIPFSISTGKPDDMIRVSLLYSLGAVSVILSLSSLWLGCYVMSHDIDSYQIHMVVSKPVSRFVIWLGKWSGINLINLILLFISWLVVYGMVMYRYYEAGEESRFSGRAVARENAEAERERIRSQILVGRRSFMPEQPDPEKVADAAVQRRIQELKKEGKKLTDEEIIKMHSEIREQVDKLPVEVLPGQNHIWKFTGIDPEYRDQQMVVSFRPYLNKVASEDQRESLMWWMVQNPEYAAKTGDQGSFMPIAQPQTYFTGIFHEHKLPLKDSETLPQGIINDKGEVKILMVNADTQDGKLYFQHADGPKLLVPICSFEVNYLRAMLVMMVQLMLLAGVACAFGGFLTMPTAIFMVVSYMLFGAFSLFLTDSEFFVSNSFDKFSQGLAHTLLLVVIPLQKFSVTDMLSNGELIELSYIFELFWKYLLLRGVPLFGFGMWLYWRREMGSAVRK